MGKSKNDYVSFTGKVVHETPGGAYIIETHALTNGEDSHRVVIPKSQVCKQYKTDEGINKIVIKRWLAEERGIAAS